MSHHSPTGFIYTPDGMTSKCPCCFNESQHTITIKCRYRPGYDDIQKVWTDIPAYMNISFCSTHLHSYLKNREEHDVKYGVESYSSSGKDWWDILDGVTGLPEFSHNK